MALRGRARQIEVLTKGSRGPHLLTSPAPRRPARSETHSPAPLMRHPVFPLYIVRSNEGSIDQTERDACQLQHVNRLLRSGRQTEVSSKGEVLTVSRTAEWLHTRSLLICSLAMYLGDQAASSDELSLRDHFSRAGSLPLNETEYHARANFIPCC